MTRERLKSFREAFAYGLTDEEACRYAGVKSPQTLYNYEKAHPEFKEEKLILKSDLRMKAKLALAKMIAPEDGESPPAELLKWYLSHRARDEFGTRIEHGGEIASGFNVDIKVIE